MKSLFTIILIILWAFGYSQDPYHIIYNLENGLPSNEVYDIHIDSNNVVWGTTDRGVFTYNGYDFASYSTEDGLAYNTNFKIIDDTKGKLWFTGYDGSLSYFTQGRFIPCVNNIALKNQKERIYYYDLGMDNNANYYTHKQTFSKVRLSHHYISLHKDSTVTSGLDDFKEIAYCTEADFTLKQKIFINTSFYLIPELGQYVAVHISKLTGIGYFIIHKKMKRYEEPTSVIYQIDNQQIKKIYTTGKIINELYIDDKNNLLCSTDYGIQIHQNCKFEKDPIVLFPDNKFTNINQDQEGNYWCSTHKSGIMFIPSLIALNSPDLKHLNKSILSLKKTSDKLFFSSSNYGIAYLDSLKQLQHIINGVTYGDINNLIKINDTLYVLGVGFINPNSPKLCLVKNKNRKYREHSVLNIQDSLFLLSGSSELYMLDKSSNKIYSTRNDPKIKRISVTSMSYDTDQAWIGTMSGLYTFLPTEKKLKKYKTNKETLDIRINDIVPRDKNKIWIASIGHGLISISNDKLTSISIGSGMNSNMINCLYIQNDSTLWAGTNRGLNKVVYSEIRDSIIIESITNLTVTDGLHSNFINDITMWNGNIWVATTKGLQPIDPLIDPVINIKPKILIDKIQCDNTNNPFINNMVLSSNENTINIHYTGICYKKPNKGFYKYSLQKGTDNQEFNFTDNRSVRYSNLKPGSYNFKVYCRNKYDIWSKPAIINFIIEPHFSSTWWFILISLCIILFIIYYLYKSRITNIIKREQQERVLNEAILQTEIAELSTFRNQFNPHFIFNSLNSIQNYIFNDDLRKANRFLSNFSRLIRQSLNLTKEKLITIEQEVEFLKSYLDIELMRFPNKFSFSIENKENIPLDLFLIPPMLMQPAVENVLKHAFNNIDQGRLIIEIITDSSNHAFKLNIIDNGPGLNDKKDLILESKRTSFGLKIIEDRIALLQLDFPKTNSSFTIKNRANEQGSIVTFVIPKIHK